MERLLPCKLYMLAMTYHTLVMSMGPLAAPILAPHLLFSFPTSVTSLKSPFCSGTFLLI